MKSKLLTTIIIAAFYAMFLSMSSAQEDAGRQPSAAAKSDPGYAIIVLDASGSMWGQVNGEAKIVIARRVIRQLVTRLPENVHLGLVAYGHRKKGDCSDIQLLIEPGKVDSKRFINVVDNITPKGMTPLTSAIEFAAENLAFKEQKASVILVSDGKETCDRDPCEAAKKLEKLGVDFTAHVVAFDLSEKDAKSIECIARETGGRFLTANDAGTLADALQMAIDEVREERQPEIKLDPATVKGPAKVAAGSEFQVEWTGPDNKGDYITIVPKAWEDGRYKYYGYTRNGSPLKLTALMDVGPAELRYMAAKGGKVLGRADIEVTPVQATLKADAECLAGAEVTIEWTGPNNKGDFITIVPKKIEDGNYKRYAYTQEGSPVKVVAPVDPGDCEIRYMSGRERVVLGRTDIKVNKAEVTLKAPGRCTVGNTVQIEWTGPNNKGDFITIVPKNTEDGKYLRYEYTAKGAKIGVDAPVDAGACEVRYYSGQGRKVLARIPIEVEAAKIILKADSETVAGSPVLIDWTGPDNRGDFLTIVPKNAADGTYAKYAYTRDGSPTRVVAPIDPGDCEIRYMSGQKRLVLGRVGLKVVKAEITLKAEAQAAAGSEVVVHWTGPSNPRDYITIVPKDTKEGKYGKFAYTSKGSPLRVMAPAEAGDCEIRFVSGQGGVILHRIPILITPVTRE
ncbi:MAG: VWA domain-containing protein [Akkermansiaceae bacterium]|nr:VWA domain-containing protein [Akkermansiaceae bacterium]